MKKFNVGDKVKIIQRKTSNRTGNCPGWDIANGNVGDIGVITYYSEPVRPYYVSQIASGRHIGSFDEEDLELVSATPYVKGKWYGCKDWNNKHCYVKLDYIYSDKTRIYFTECIDNTEYRQINDWWGIEKKELFEADMSIVSQFLPEGHPDKIGSEEFVLPKKWCIKLTEENVDVLGKWRSSGLLKDPKYAKEGWYLHTPKHGANGYNELSKDPDYTEITFEQFKQHVLKESPVVETTKEIDMKAIQEEAKRRFPIGCKFMNASGDGPFTLKEDNNTYHIIVGTNTINIWAHTDVGCLYENGKWATLVSLPETKEEESIPEYVECISPLLHATVGKIYKVIDHNVCESDLKEYYYHWKTFQFKPSTKEAYEAQNVFSAEYIPQVGDYVVMEKAGGWGYSPHNNGCIAIVEKVSTREVGYPSELVTVPSIGGTIINPKKLNDTVFTNIPIIGHEKELVFRKALPHEIPSDLPKKTVIEEWEPGTYAVGVKGNFGVYKGSKNSIPVGHIYTIKENRKDDLVLEGSQFWVYKENLKWFATREAAETFSKGLITGHITIDSSEKVKPISQLWMGDPIVEERINTPSIKKETFIENVQSVNVMLRTKKKSIKF